MEFNIYCDESNHLMHSNSIMTLGFIQTEKKHSKYYNKIIRALKKKHGLDQKYEIKWTKISLSKMDFYTDLVDLFFNSDDLSFRCIISDKKNLNFDRYNLDHDSWYYRMYYLLLGKTLNEKDEYNVYIDIKDTCGHKKISQLHTVLNNSYYKFSDTMIKKIQLIHSHEVELLQLCDLFIGAIGYRHNNLVTSKAKLTFIDYLESQSGINLNFATSISRSKFNLFIWEADYDL